MSNASLTKVWKPGAAALSIPGKSVVPVTKLDSCVEALDDGIRPALKYGYHIVFEELLQRVEIFYDEPAPP